MEERLSALGNVTTCNDYVALVHPDLDRVQGSGTLGHSEWGWEVLPTLRLELFPPAQLWNVLWRREGVRGPVYYGTGQGGTAPH